MLLKFIKDNPLLAGFSVVSAYLLWQRSINARRREAILEYYNQGA